MGFGTEFTEEEFAELKKIDSIYDRLLPKRSPESKNTAKTSFTNGSDYNDRSLLRDFFVASAGSPSVARMGPNTPGIAAKWKMMLHEINGEVVVRGSQSIRSTRAVTNRILYWSTIFQQADRAAAVISLGHDGGRALAREWMRGIVIYFQERMDKLFAHLNISAQEDTCVQKLKLQGADGVDVVSQCIEAARTVISPVLTTSPYFIGIIRCCREMVLALKVIQELLFHISLHTRLILPSTATKTSEGQRNSISTLTLNEDLLQLLRTPLWLFRLILLFLGALDIQQSPKRGSAISDLHLDHSIHWIAYLVTEVEAKRESTTPANLEVRATLDALVLGHIKNACLSRFPPSKTVELLDQKQDVLEELAVSDAPGSLITRCGPVLKQLLVDYPTFMESTAKFAERNEMSDLGTSLMLVQLFCWDINTSPEWTAPTKRPMSYHVPKLAEPFPHGSTVLNALVRKALHPLFFALFAKARCPSKNDDDCGGNGAKMETAGAEPSHAHSASDQGTPLFLSPFEQRVAATLLALATWLRSLSFPVGPRMPKWASLDVGDQVMREFHLGQDGFKGVVSDVLHDVIAAALAQVEKELRRSSDTGTAATAFETDESASELGAAVLRYVLRVERIWNALTDHTIELHLSAMDDVVAVGAKTLPVVSTESIFDVAADEGVTTACGRYNTGLYEDCKYLFYDVVQNVMRVRWPKRYADLLTDPLLHSVHLYLLRAERATRWGGRLRPVAPSGTPGRLVRLNRPKLPTEEASGDPAPHTASVGIAATPASRSPAGAAVQDAVILVTKEDLHSALRLVRCIKNRDNFVHCYIITVRERLLTRPGPDITSDTELQDNKKRHEQEAEQFLTTWLGDVSLLKPVRDIHRSYSTQTVLFTPTPESSAAAAAAAEAPTQGIKLTTTILDWRLWGEKETKPTTTLGQADERDADPAAPRTSAAELLSEARQALTMGTSATATLPFPIDALTHLEKVEHAYNENHLNRTLRWDWDDHAYTSFTLQYPKEGGRLTTIHGPLLLQRLFLAVAAYGRTGVAMETLAKRAGMDERRIAAALKPCLDRDRLLVRISGESDGANAAGLRGGKRIALNYDYIRPPNCPRSEFTYWPNAERRRVTAGTAEHDSTIKKRRNMIKTSIMQVMKHAQRIKHDDLFETVRVKNAKVFDVTMRHLKQEIEALIGQDFMARSDINGDEYVFRA
ncbi:hypothetical protein JKF63_03899 [Porcisia hertigi]|uniref:Cullin neddylation domain-containing protein n=1 Tax=Porcisia hertigi TaxID=2761500 RepID=A0A836HU65_9TRYP|nr:hypothetical protein JKF63_03899 [Porcisia hertigi]